MFICFWEEREREREREREKGKTERQSTSQRGAKKEGDTESEGGFRLWAVSIEPDVGLKLTTCEIMTWAEVGHPTDWATQAPQQ